MPTIQYTCDGFERRILLSIPDRHNSLGRREFEGMHRILDELESEQDARILVISGSGERTFCAGAALNELGSGEITGQDFQAVTDRVAALEIPTLAVLNGNAFGGGVELALSCDFRIGVTGIRMRVPAAAIGLCYPVNGIERFVSRLGMQNAKRILMGAEEFDADEMLSLGVLDMLVGREQIQAAEKAIVSRFKALAPLAVKSMKKIISQSADKTLDMKSAEAVARDCNSSYDLAEGLAAQREKRAAVFRGI